VARFRFFPRWGEIRGGTTLIAHGNGLPATVDQQVERACTQGRLESNGGLKAAGFLSVPFSQSGLLPASCPDGGHALRRHT
jgi:hypothetical protein